jgi:transcriptional regulator GlxA family with amidase domain
VGQVAQRIAVSERQLYRIFSETGEGVARVILSKRLDLAKRILVSPGTLSIGDVAAHCGFSSHAHFARVFRQRFDDTPAGIRHAGRTQFN